MKAKSVLEGCLCWSRAEYPCSLFQSSVEQNKNQQASKNKQTKTSKQKQTKTRTEQSYKQTETPETAKTAKTQRRRICTARWGTIPNCRLCVWPGSGLGQPPLKTDCRLWTWTAPRRSIGMLLRSEILKSCSFSPRNSFLISCMQRRPIRAKSRRHFHCFSTRPALSPVQVKYQCDTEQWIARSCDYPNYLYF